MPHGVLVAERQADPRPADHDRRRETLARRLNGLDLKPDLIVIDEAHHAVAATWRKILEAFPTVHVLGVTATPARLDGTGLRDVFDELMLGPTVRELIDADYLASSLTYARAGAEEALRSLRRVGGDYATGQLERLMLDMGVTQAAVHERTQLAQGQHGFAFCVTVRHAEGVAEAFRRSGVPAASLDGGLRTADRDNILANFAKGEIKLLALLRSALRRSSIAPTPASPSSCADMSLTVHRQQVGRILRPKADGGHVYHRPRQQHHHPRPAR